MTKLLFRWFIREESCKTLRTQYGTLSGTVGIVLNLLLACFKVFVGVLLGSIAVIGDALNNLSDAGSSVISLVGFKISAKPADKEHPYGHGRVEYLCGLMVSVMILFMGLELLKSAFIKILHPELPIFSGVSVLLLLISIGLKIWLAIFYREVDARIGSEMVGAVVTDSICDVISTLVSVLAVVLSTVFKVSLDGYFGVVVAIFVLYAGIKVFVSTMTPLIGKPPEAEVVQNIKERILSYEGVVGVHDLIVHDYGANHRFVTAHAEISAATDMMEGHNLIDVIERDLKKDLGFMVTLHMDPVVTDDEEVNCTLSLITALAKEMDESLSIHDFRMVSGPMHTNLIFDVVVPYSMKCSGDFVVEKLTEKIQQVNPKYYPVITVDFSIA